MNAFAQILGKARWTMGNYEDYLDHEVSVTAAWTWIARRNPTNEWIKMD